MPGRCPNGHTSTSVDVCEFCGAPMPPASTVAETQVVPAVDDLDTAGATAVMGTYPGRDQPTQEWLSTTPTEWVAEITVDPDWYQGQQTTHRLPGATPPAVVGLHSRSVLIGRRSTTRGTHPDLDCSADPGVSRRHAQLTFDGHRWYIEDLDSSNGTFVARAEALPDVPVPRRSKVELAGTSRVYLGAWTRIVVRPAQPHERGM